MLNLGTLGGRSMRGTLDITYSVLSREFVARLLYPPELCTLKLCTPSVPLYGTRPRNALPQ